MLYPFLFHENLHVAVWGEEQWGVSAVPSSPNIIQNGEFAGQNLIDVIERMPQEILGIGVSEDYNNKLPLLAKIIDAKKDLSIQVHPNDEMALRVHGKMGKSEMWYIIDAAPGSYLYAGFKEQISPEEFKQLIEESTKTPVDGNLPPSSQQGEKMGLEAVLARHEVHSGDVFYLPAGRVHAIGGGIKLAEIQQSSDVTYRIFDYNRLGLDGKPRELHTELAAQAIDYQVQEDYKTHYETRQDAANRVLSTPFFSIRLTEAVSPIHRNLLKYDSFVIVMCVRGTCKIRIRSNQHEIELQEGRSCLIPAAIADYDVIPVVDENIDSASDTERPKGALLLDAFIDNKDRSLTSMFTRFLHITQM